MNKKLDVIYTTVDVLMKGNCWEFLNDTLKDVSQKAWRTDVIELIAWTTATLPGKSKLPYRPEFIKHCKRLFPSKEKWRGLE